MGDMHPVKAPDCNRINLLTVKHSMPHRHLF
jgi:hypothetical protein